MTCNHTVTYTAFGGVMTHQCTKEQHGDSQHQLGEGTLTPTPYQTDAPACSECGNLMQQAGACHTCSTCGSTSGCG